MASVRLSNRILNAKVTDPAVDASALDTAVVDGRVFNPRNPLIRENPRFRQMTQINADYPSPPYRHFIVPTRYVFRMTCILNPCFYVFICGCISS